LNDVETVSLLLSDSDQSQIVSWPQVLADIRSGVTPEL